jgi:hypothetical protein
MLVFIDESGDTGTKFGKGSSPYFVVALVVFHDTEQATACDKRIDELREELGVKPGYEFKFNTTRKEFRSAFYQAVLPFTFFYYGIVINKQDQNARPLLADRKIFYRYACGLVLESANAQLRDATVIVDGSGSQTFQRQIRTYLKRKMPKLIRKLKLKSSRGNNLLQLADMIAGAVHRSFGLKSDKNRYKRMLKPHEISVRVWP